jgi:hypothetical protein
MLRDFDKNLGGPTEPGWSALDTAAPKTSSLPILRRPWRGTTSSWKVSTASAPPALCGLTSVGLPALLSA